jgi:hypothetical protein
VPVPDPIGTWDDHLLSGRLASAGIAAVMLG